MKKITSTKCVQSKSSSSIVSGTLTFLNWKSVGNVYIWIYCKYLQNTCWWKSFQPCFGSCLIFDDLIVSGRLQSAFPNDNRTRCENFQKQLVVAVVRALQKTYQSPRQKVEKKTPVQIVMRISPQEILYHTNQLHISCMSVSHCYWKEQGNWKYTHLKRPSLPKGKSILDSPVESVREKTEVLETKCEKKSYLTQATYDKSFMLSVVWMKLVSLYAMKKGIRAVILTSSDACRSSKLSHPGEVRIQLQDREPHETRLYQSSALIVWNDVGEKFPNYDMSRVLHSRKMVW